MPKSTKILSVIALILALWAALALFQSRRTNTLSAEDTQFAVVDSGSVSKIILSTNNKTEIELSQPLGKWLINRSMTADEEKIYNLLSFVYRAQVKRPVYKEQANTVINQLKTSGLKVNYFGENGIIKSFLIGYFGGSPDEMIALIEGFQTPYVVQIPGFSGNLAQLFSVNTSSWKTRTIFNSNLNDIKKLKVSFNYYPENSFDIQKNGKSFQVSLLEKQDSLRLYSYLQLYENVQIKQWIDDKNNFMKDSLSKLKPAFEIELEDKNPKKSNEIQIFFNDGQKGNIYGLVGKSKDICIIRTSIFEYLLQKKSFFEGKK